MRSPMCGVLAGIVLLAGCTSDRSSTTLEPQHPATALDVPRAVHRATLLAGGRVLFTGGCTAPGCGDAERVTRTEVFDASTVRIGYGPKLAVPRLSHTATRLLDGRVART